MTAFFTHSPRNVPISWFINFIRKILLGLLSVYLIEPLFIKGLKMDVKMLTIGFKMIEEALWHFLLILEGTVHCYTFCIFLSILYLKNICNVNPKCENKSPVVVNLSNEYIYFECQNTRQWHVNFTCFVECKQCSCQTLHLMSSWKSFLVCNCKHALHGFY